MTDGPQLYLKCEFCLTFFEYNGGKRKRYCSDAHKQAAWRAAQAAQKAEPQENNPENHD